MTAATGTARLQQYPIGAGGLTTRVLECGQGDDVVVCLHGSGSRADRWAPVLPLFAAAGFHAYALDFPGHGLADKPAGYAYGTPAFAEVVAGALDTLDLGSVSLVGTSLGGHVAAWVACEQPARVARLVLVGAVGLVPVAGARPPASPIVSTGLDGIRAKLELLLTDHDLITDEWVREESRINSSPGAAAALAELSRYSAEQLDDDVVGERLAGLGIPTLLVWGADDRWIPPSVGHAARDVLPAAPLLLLDHAGHAPYVERPDTFTKLVAEFLRRPDACAPAPFTA